MRAKPDTRREIAAGIRAALPIVAGYLPAAVAFGVAAREAGLSVVEAVGMSLIIFSGASQLALVGLIAGGAPGPTAAATALLLSLWHVLYGPVLARRLRGFGTGRTLMAAFGLTDEVFAVASGRSGEPVRFGWLLCLEAGAYVSWALGTWAGAAGGDTVVQLMPSLAPALGFALPAIFAALLVPVLLRPGRELAAAAAGAATALVLHLAGLGGWSVLAAGVLGPAAALILERSHR